MQRMMIGAIQGYEEVPLIDDMRDQPLTKQMLINEFFLDVKNRGIKIEIVDGKVVETLNSIKHMKTKAAEFIKELKERRKNAVKPLTREEEGAIEKFLTDVNTSAALDGRPQETVAGTATHSMRP